MRIAIVGAGMAGLSCADGLAAAGHSVILLDKGRGPGGRMSTRRMDTPLGQASFDHGAQYFTARDPDFQQQVEDWATGGVVAPWAAAATGAWVGTPGMSAVIKTMATSHTVHWNTPVDRLERTGSSWLIRSGQQTLDGFDTVVLAIPAEQAAPLLSPHDAAMAKAALSAPSQPCWTAMFAFAEPLIADRDVIRDAGAIGWACRNSSKPGREGPESWVVQANPQWSRTHLEGDPADVSALLLLELSVGLGIDLPRPILAAAHRWRFAMSAGLGDGALWNRESRLGACGDWLLGPRIECAWLSGQRLARLVAQAAPVDAPMQESRST